MNVHSFIAYIGEVLEEGNIQGGLIVISLVESTIVAGPS